MGTPSSCSCFSWKKFLLAALGVYLLALCFRLDSISAPGPQPDEIHWQNRAYQIIKTARERDFANLTTHLPHPGVPSAYVMAIGEYIVEKYNLRRGYEIGDDGYVNRLTGARVAIAVMCSLTPVVLMAGLIPFFGMLPGLLSGILLALDPQHIAISQIAHIDALMALTAAASIFLFLYALRSGKVWLKIAAGICWGLTLASKPTAAALVVGFLVTKLLRYPFVRNREDCFERNLLAWSDFWAVIVGHLTFVAVYTRLWHPVVRQWYKLNYWYGARSWVDAVAEQFQACRSVVLVLLGFLLLGSLVLLVRGRAKPEGLSFHILMLSSFATLFGSLLLFAPQIVENLAGYWAWVLGLSKEKHVAYGRVWQPAPGGYWMLFATKLPTLALAAIFSGLVLCGVALMRRRTEDSLQRGLAVLGLLSCALCWTVLLSFSAKQTYRYAIPILPAFYGIAGFGVFPFFAKAVIARWVLAGFALIQLMLTWSWSPHYSSFFNIASGGLEAAHRRGAYMPYVGQKEAVDWLLDRSREEDSKILAMVVGDLQAADYTYRLKYPEQFGDKEKPMLEFFGWSPAANGYYVLAHRSVLNKIEGVADLFAKRSVGYEHKVRGVTMYYIYEPAEIGRDQPLVFKIPQMKYGIGGIERIEELDNRKVLVARSGRHKNGFLFFGDSARLNPGLYMVKVRMGLPPGTKVNPSFGPERYVARLELGAGCERIVKLEEIQGKENFPWITFPCEIERRKHARVQMYWFANISVAVSDFEVHQ